MRKPTLIVIDSSVRRAALDVAIPASCGELRVWMEIYRAGKWRVEPPLVHYAVGFDDEGRAVFEWTDSIHALHPGLYRAAILANGIRCGTYLMRIGDYGSVLGIDNGHFDSCGSACENCACEEPREGPFIYHPTYTIPPRGY